MANADSDSGGNRPVPINVVQIMEEGGAKLPRTFTQVWRKSMRHNVDHINEEMVPPDSPKLPSAVEGILAKRASGPEEALPSADVDEWLKQQSARLASRLEESAESDNYEEAHALEDENQQPEGDEIDNAVNNFENVIIGSRAINRKKQTDKQRRPRPRRTVKLDAKQPTPPTRPNNGNGRNGQGYHHKLTTEFGSVQISVKLENEGTINTSASRQCTFAVCRKGPSHDPHWDRRLFIDVLREVELCLHLKTSVTGLRHGSDNTPICSGADFSPDAENEVLASIEPKDSSTSNSNATHAPETVAELREAHHQIRISTDRQVLRLKQAQKAVQRMHAKVSSKRRPKPIITVDYGAHMKPAKQKKDSIWSPPSKKQKKRRRKHHLQLQAHPPIVVDRTKTTSPRKQNRLQRKRTERTTLPRLV